MTEKIFEFNCEKTSIKLKTPILDKNLFGQGFFYVVAQNFAKIEIEVSSYIGNQDFRIIWQVSDDKIPSHFVEGVIDGVKKWCESRHIKGLQLKVLDGDFHYIDSRNYSYALATIIALDDAFSEVIFE